MSKNKSAFTLIELLVVIAILGVISTIAIFSFSGTQQSSRDTRRKSDLKQFQVALETFAAKNNNLYPHYDGVDVSSLCTTLNTGTTCTDDPQTTAHYRYFSSGGSGIAGSATAISYVLYATMERQEGNSTQYWVVCSNGTSGRINTSSWTPSANCPGGLMP